MGTHKGTVLRSGNGLCIRLPNTDDNHFIERDKILITFNDDGSITIKKTPMSNFYIKKGV